MKKLLVFTLVVSMLAVAGVAFADDTSNHGTVTPEEQAAEVVSDVEGYSSMTDDEKTTVQTAIADAIKSNSQVDGDTAVTIYNTISSTATATAAAATSTLDTTEKTASDNNKEGVPSGSEVVNVADLTSSGAVSVDTADVATTAALMKKVAADSTLAAFPAPKLTVDPAKVSDDTVLEVTMFNKNFSADLFASVNKLVFYPDPVNSPDVSSDNMWLLYMNPGDTAFKTLTSSSSSSDIRAVKDLATVLQRFIYHSTAFTGVKGAALNASGDMVFSGAFMTSKASSSSGGSGGSTPGGDDEPTTHTLGGSGGGCVAGTSVLALAVLGVFLAKRRG